MKKKVTVQLVTVQQKDIADREWKEFVSGRHEEDERGYSDNDITISFKADGTMCFSDDTLEGQIIYLYPEQVKHLESVLRKRKAMLKGKGNAKTSKRTH